MHYNLHVLLCAEMCTIKKGSLKIKLFFNVTYTFQILKRDVYTCMRRTCSYIPLMKQNVTCKRVQRSI